MRTVVSTVSDRKYLQCSADTTTVFSSAGILDFVCITELFGLYLGGWVGGLIEFQCVTHNAATVT